MLGDSVEVVSRGPEELGADPQLLVGREEVHRIRLFSGAEWRGVTGIACG